MTELIDLLANPTMEAPVMVVALEGWIDAGSAAAGAMQSIIDGDDTTLLATFDTDRLLDQRARRPIMSLSEGLMTDLTWPSIELRRGQDTSGRDVVYLAGAEPDHLWHEFCSDVTEVIGTLGITTVIGLGAYPAAVPHTRPTRLALTSPSEAVMAANPDFVRGSLEVPAGIQAAIEMQAHEAGLPAMGLWAQVPHYISGVPYPAGSVALINGLEKVAGLRIATGELPDQADLVVTQLDSLVVGNEQHQAMVGALETTFDEALDGGLDGPLPTGDEIADEFQAFLREQDG